MAAAADLAGTGGAGGGAPERADLRPFAALFGPYALGVELASMLLLAGLVGAYHLARPARAGEGERER